MPSGMDMLVTEIADRVVDQLRKRPIEQKVLTAKQAAKYLGVSDEKMRQLAANGTLPAVRIDSSIRFDLDDLNLLIETHKR